jgi:RNA polymerase sigma factor (TIGR02999 family)
VPERDRDIDTLVQQADLRDPIAVDALFAECYRELHRLAESHIRRAGPGATLSPTTLLHEAYLNLSGRTEVAFRDQGRFLAYAARAMRGLVIDYVRRRQALKRGRDIEVPLTDDLDAAAEIPGAADELRGLSDALDELASVSPMLAELVDLYFFCGFTFGEIAVLRNVSERTIQRDWRKARLLLHRALLEASAPE